MYRSLFALALVAALTGCGDVERADGNAGAPAESSQEITSHAVSTPEIVTPTPTPTPKATPWFEQKLLEASGTLDSPQRKSNSR